MFKLVVLSALLAVAAARPGHLLESSPVVYSAPATTTIVQEPYLANVGSVVKSVPTSVSHQSQSVVHSSAHVVQDVVAPVVKTYAAPVVHTSYAAAAPVYQTTYAAAAPVVHTSYAAAAPVVAGHYSAVAASSPLTYTATGVWYSRASIKEIDSPSANHTPSPSLRHDTRQRSPKKAPVKMFKLFVLAALLAVAAAKPGHLAAAPLVYSAPATTIVQESSLAKIGAVVKSVPTAVSHQSLTQVHSTPVVEDVVAPVVRTTAVHSAPLVKTVAAAPVAYSAPLTYSAPVAYASPLAYSHPVAYSSPVAYAAAPAQYHAPLTYAAHAW
ncbi:uncharacterized protein [Drosophila pseudoobscura]|uniref:Cuticle protein 16.5 n=2 Tax=pseudoobscura subgroup TaxID=32358 RepID=A0A6I8UAU6_DROPS|nr:uncharacterized protein LOC4812161 [Drosophila pseudoobscura]